MPGSARRAVGYGIGEVAVDLEGIELLDRKDVVERLMKVFRHPAYAPPKLPASAVRLLELTRRSDVSIAEVTAHLQEDQMLAAEVLRLAQSSQYQGGTAAPVRTLGEAVMRLGLQRTAEVFLQAAMNLRVFRVRGYQAAMDRLRRHSVAVAHLARLVSRQTSVYDEHAFLCGLLHDVGIAAAWIALAESTPRGQQPPDLELVGPAVEQAHELAGEALARLWELPPEVGFVLAHHHRILVGGHIHPTAAAVNLANYLAQELGAGFGSEHDEMVSRRAARALGLDASTVQRLLVEGEALIAPLDG